MEARRLTVRCGRGPRFLNTAEEKNHQASCASERDWKIINAAASDKDMLFPLDERMRCDSASRTHKRAMETPP